MWYCGQGYGYEVFYSQWSGPVVLEFVYSNVQFGALCTIEMHVQVNVVQGEVVQHDISTVTSMVR